MHVATHARSRTAEVTLSRLYRFDGHITCPNKQTKLNHSPEIWMRLHIGLHDYSVESDQLDSWPIISPSRVLGQG